MGDVNSIFNLIHMIEKITNENVVRFTDEFSYPISISTIIVLGEIETSGPIKQIDLVESLGYSKSTITNIANKLVKFDLVERIYNKSDRRTVHLKITAKGTEALNEARSIGDKIYMDLFGILTKDELSSYIEIQKKLLDNISAKKKLSF